MIFQAVCPHCGGTAEFEWTLSGGLESLDSRYVKVNRDIIVIRREYDNSKNILNITCTTHGRIFTAPSYRHNIRASVLESPSCTMKQDTDPHVFKISCSSNANPPFDKRKRYYRVYENDPHRIMLGTIYTSNHHMIFGRATTKYVVDTVDVGDRIYSGSVELDANFDFKPMFTGTIEDVIKGLKGVYEGTIKFWTGLPVKWLGEQNEVECTTQTMHVILRDLQNTKFNLTPENLIELANFKVQMMDDLKELDFGMDLDYARIVLGVLLTSSETALQMGAKNAKEYYKTAEAMKRTADKALLIIEESVEPILFMADVILYASGMVDLWILLSIPNEGDIKPPDVVSNKNDAVGDILMEDITENYDQYESLDPERDTKIAYYRETWRLMEESFLNVARTLLQATVDGDDGIDINTSKLRFQLISEPTNVLYYIEIGWAPVYKVKFQPKLAKLYDWYKYLSVLVVEFKSNESNPLWYDLSKEYYRLPVLYVQLFDTRSSVGMIEDLLRIEFNIQKDTNPETMSGDYNQFLAIAPLKLEKWIPSRMERLINVHRIDVNHGAALFINFQIAEKESLEVLVTYNKVPLWEQFDDARYSQQVKTFYAPNKLYISFIPHELTKYGDVWGYIAVRPAKSNVHMERDTSDISINYNVSFKIFTCAYWSVAFNTWLTDACFISEESTPQYLVCVCHHFSSFVRVTFDAQHVLVPFHSLKVVIQRQICFIAYIAVFLALALYCLILCCGVKKGVELNQTMYYLADNIPVNAYGYILCVKTGIQSDAGTTSNITIIVEGTNCDSKPHLINYPDPEMRLLQRDQEDTFVFTTECFLGDIIQIALWHDSVGARPSWYCEWLTVMDMQTKKEYYFQVNAWFSVLDKETRPLRVKVVDEKIRKKLRDRMGCISRLAQTAKDHLFNLCQTFQTTDLPFFHRMTLILSIHLLTFSCAFSMYGVPKLRMYDSLGFGEISINAHVIACSLFAGATSYFTHIAIVTLFRYAFYKNLFTHQTMFLVVLPWIMLITVLLGSFTFLIIYGFWLPYISSVLFMISSGFAILQIIFIFEGAHIIFKNLIFFDVVKLNRFVTGMAAVIHETEYQRDKLYEKFGPFLLRPFFSEKYKPLTRTEWLVKREKEWARRRYSRFMTDTILYILYFLTLLLFIIYTKNSTIGDASTNLKQIIDGSAWNEYYRFSKVRTTEDIYNYLSQTLKSAINANNWYNGWFERNPGLMRDFNTKIIGIGRLRQIRVSEGCTVAPQFASYFEKNCMPEYSWLNRDEKVYVQKWKVFNASDKRNIISKVWAYLNEGFTFVGDSGNYPSGGYVAYLPRDKVNYPTTLGHFQENNWLDKRTRLISLEFLAYNANANTFHAVMFVIEKLATGLFIQSERMDTFEAVSANDTDKQITLIIFFVFVMLTVLLLARNLLEAGNYWALYSHDFWCIWDFCTLLITSIFSIFSAYKFYLIEAFFQRMSTSRQNTMLEYKDIVIVQRMITFFLGLSFAMILIRIFSIMQLTKSFRLIKSAFGAIWKSAVCLLIVHLLMLLTFSLCANCFFGSRVKDFRHFSTSFETLVLLSMTHYNSFDYNNFWEKASLARPFYIFFASIMLIIKGFYIAIILVQFQNGRRNIGLDATYKFTDYLRDEYKFRRGLVLRKKKRFAGGGLPNPVAALNQTPTVSPKEWSLRNKNVYSISDYRLYVMSLVAKSVILQDAAGVVATDSDEMYALAFHILCKQEDDSAQFTGFRSPESSPIIVSDFRFKQMERVAHNILLKGAGPMGGFEQNMSEYMERVNEQLDFTKNTLSTIKDVLAHIAVIKHETEEDNT
ncbi:polycystic kidney disease protein 1-like 2 isoform X2 [Photinus pyralis]|nr:polycystic kidney disease protein 1-like 2 isoform X2 [Photinus pyralis]